MGGESGGAVIYFVKYFGTHFLNDFVKDFTLVRMSTAGELLPPLGLIGLGVLFVYGAFVLLSEYRQTFMANPRSVMSVEVLFAILRLGGPGYLAMLVLTIGALFLLLGTFVLLLIASTFILNSGGGILTAIGQTFGWQ